jgi:hypothetical protein
VHPRRWLWERSEALTTEKLQFQWTCAFFIAEKRCLSLPKTIVREVSGWLAALHNAKLMPVCCWRANQSANISSISGRPYLRAAVLLFGACHAVPNVIGAGVAKSGFIQSRIWLRASRSSRGGTFAARISSGTLAASATMRSGSAQPLQTLAPVDETRRVAPGI